MPQVLETSGLAWARLHSGTGVGAVALTGLGWGRPPPPKYRLLLGWGSDFGYSSRVVRYFSRDLDNPLEVRRFGFVLTGHGLTSPGSVAADVVPTDESELTFVEEPGFAQLTEGSSLDSF